VKGLGLVSHPEVYFPSGKKKAVEKEVIGPTRRVGNEKGGGVVY